MLVKALLFAACSISLSAQTSEFIADPMPTPSAHASTVIEVKPGELMASWFGGTAEGRPDVAIYAARKRSGKWEAPTELAREKDTPTWNPVLFRGPDQILWFYYKFGTSPREWSAGRRLSKDNGATWTVAEHLPAGLSGPIRAKPLVLPNGVIVSGTSVESYQSWAAWIERSTDKGKTWTRHGPIVPPTGGIIQPTIVPLGGKRLRFLARSTMGSICVSDSNDEGITWTPARPIDLPNPSAGIDAVRLKDGRYVMIYNHTAKGRTPLNLAVSNDAEHWTRFVDLESEPGEYSYPAMVEASDGSLQITYTWQRKKIKYVNFPLAKVPKP